MLKISSSKRNGPQPQVQGTPVQGLGFKKSKA